MSVERVIVSICECMGEREKEKERERERERVNVSICEGISESVCLCL